MGSDGSRGLCRGRILVVDDDRDTLALLEGLLETRGYAIDRATEAEEAFLALTQTRPTVILLDLMMPGEDGWAICRRVKELTADVPVVIVTALDTPEARQSAEQLHADAFVTKPFNCQELLSIVERLAGHGPPGVAGDGPGPDDDAQGMRDA